VYRLKKQKGHRQPLGRGANERTGWKYQYHSLQPAEGFCERLESVHGGMPQELTASSVGGSRRVFSTEAEAWIETHLFTTTAGEKVLEAHNHRSCNSPNSDPGPTSTERETGGGRGMQLAACSPRGVETIRFSSPIGATSQSLRPGGAILPVSATSGYRA